MIKSKFALHLIMAIPLLTLFYVMLVMGLSLFGYYNKDMYIFINGLLSTSVAYLLPYYFLAYRYKYCAYIKWTLHALILYTITNKINYLYNIDDNYYLTLRFISIFIIFVYSVLNFKKGYALQINKD